MSEKQEAAMPQEPATQGIEQSRFRQVTVPVPTESLKEFFTNKSIIFIADYSESRLKGDAFLTYLTNANIPCDVHFSKGLDYETYAEIMLAYMKQISVIDTPVLHIMAAEMILYAKGMDYIHSPYATAVDETVVKQFIEANRELVDRWIHFIDSTQVYTLSSIKVLSDHYKPKERFPVVNEKEYVGRNIAMLFRMPEFIVYYFSITDAKYQLSYFEPQYEEYMFKNNRLAFYFNSESNFAAVMFSHFAAGTFEANDVPAGLFALGVFDKTSEFYEPTPYVAKPEHRIPGIDETV